MIASEIFSMLKLLLQAIAIRTQAIRMSNRKSITSKLLATSVQGFMVYNLGGKTPIA